MAVAEKTEEGNIFLTLTVEEALYVVTMLGLGNPKKIKLAPDDTYFRLIDVLGIKHGPGVLDSNTAIYQQNLKRAYAFTGKYVSGEKPTRRKDSDEA